MKDMLLGVQKPGRYVGNELFAVKKALPIAVRFAFCFPDSYEIGMSHLGLKILYSLLNELDEVWCERCFAPWPDMELLLKEAEQPLCALESGSPLADFDFIGFTLQYELCFTNILNMLALGGVPVRAADRSEGDPLVIGGGPCACNPEPLALFFDLFVLGEGEEVIVELMALYQKAKREGLSRAAFLRQAADIEGVYVPALYEADYTAEGQIAAMRPLDGASARVRKRLVRDLDKVHYPDRFVMPFIEVVHDRAMLELFRGCIRGCRFCQAGFIYRPVREKSAETADRQARALCDSTGYDELSLSSLSTSDYTGLTPLLDRMTDWTVPRKINLSLPSLRIDSVDKALLERTGAVRSSGLTFAPEAGTQRLRDVINKNLTEEDILNTCITAFRSGHLNVKLYFMLGLPTETMEDIEGIAVLAQKVVDAFYHDPQRPKGKSPQVSVSVSTFIPKAFTPFQWAAQDSPELVREKQAHLVKSVTSRKIKLSWSDGYTSLLEAVFARGDRRLAEVLYTAWQSGCTFDGWGDRFKPALWQAAFAAQGLTEEFYAGRAREYGEVLPWSHLDYGISNEFLQRELALALEEKTTPHCRDGCTGCGVKAAFGGECCAQD